MLRYLNCVCDLNRWAVGTENYHNPPPFQTNQKIQSDDHLQWISSSSPEEMETKNNILDVGLIRTDAPEGTRFLVLRIRPLCHHALVIWGGSYHI